MNRAVYALASGGIAAQARLDAVTQNLANVGTAGYKAGRPVFRLHPLDVEEAGLPAPPALRAAAQVTEAETVRDFSQGPVHATGNPLDVAVTGEGFFVVATPRGERYTRQGGFGLDGEGYLVTEHGDRVQGDNGDLRLGSGDVAIGEDGQVNVDGLSVGRLKLVGFGERPGLVAEGNALFAPVRGAVPAPLDASATHVEQGSLEAANVDPVKGMVELVEVSRGFEQYMHAMQRLDEIAQRSINEVGRIG